MDLAESKRTALKNRSDAMQPDSCIYYRLCRFCSECSMLFTSQHLAWGFGCAVTHPNPVVLDKEKDYSETLGLVLSYHNKNIIYPKQTLTRGFELPDV